jgi:hypothetical protein
MSSPTPCSDVESRLKADNDEPRDQVAVTIVGESGCDALGFRIGIHVPVHTPISQRRIEGRRMRCGDSMRGFDGGVAERTLEDEQLLRKRDGGEDRVPSLLRCRLHNELASDADNIFAPNM